MQNAAQVFKNELIKLRLINEKSGSVKAKSQTQVEEILASWKKRANQFLYEGKGVTVEMVTIHKGPKEKVCFPFILSK